MSVPEYVFNDTTTYNDSIIELLNYSINTKNDIDVEIQNLRVRINHSNPDNKLYWIICSIIIGTGVFIFNKKLYRYY